MAGRRKWNPAPVPPLRGIRDVRKQRVDVGKQDQPQGNQERSYQPDSDNWIGVKELLLYLGICVLVLGCGAVSLWWMNWDSHQEIKREAFRDVRYKLENEEQLGYLMLSEEFRNWLEEVTE